MRHIQYKKIGMFVLSNLFCLVMYSQDWKYLTSDDGSDFYVQNVNAGNVFESKLWVKEVVPKLTYQKNGKNQVLVNGFVVRLMHFSCSRSEMNLSKIIYYNSKGAVAHSESFEQNGFLVNDWEPVVPGTLGAKFLLYQCGSNNY